MKISLSDWPRLVFMFVPAILALIGAAALAIEYFQPQTEKAIRMVKESSSRKENFTVQQYLYATVYHDKDQGKPIEITGWRAEPSNDAVGPITVEFSYEDAGGHHVAHWQVDVKSNKVTPLDDAAGDLSWH